MRNLALALCLCAATAAIGQTIEPVIPNIPADAYSPGRALVSDFQKIVSPNGVQESFIATLGGARQYVSVRGSDRRNPILLYVHGGPAAVETPESWAFQRPWEDFFTVVEWDQRAAGRSFALEDAAKIAPTLTPDRYRDDAIQLIELLRKRYGKPRIFLLGHSWGSTVGLAVAVKRPDLLYAYIGMGQLIDFRANEREGYAAVLAQAKADGNAQAIRELESLAPFPGPGPLSVDKTAIERRWSVYYGGLMAGRRDADFYFHIGRLSPEYGEADRKAWDAGSEFSMKILWPKLADLSFEGVKRVDTPLIFLLGRHDTTTPPAIAARWLDRVHAPSKAAIWFADSAHMMMFEEPGQMLRVLVDTVRPLAGKDLPPAR